jgi:RHS repeat-associated protein
MKYSQAKKGSTMLQMVDYVYNDFGNLGVAYKNNRINGTTYLDDETYVYDDLNRLESAEQSHGSGANNTYNYRYDSVGNFKYKSDFSSSSTSAYLYGNSARSAGGNAGPNAVRRVTLANNQGYRHYSYDNNGNLLNDGNRAFLYNSFNKPTQITTSGGRKLGAYDSVNSAASSLSFFYGADQMRYKQVKQKSGNTTTTYYIGSLYKEVHSGGTIEQRAFIGDIAVATDTIVNGTTTKKVSYLHNDRLGSAVAIINATGSVVESKSFDPFGKPRSARLHDAKTSSSISRNIVASVISNKGFTGHEHLDDAQIIHMNGRVYDYNVGRFMSVDPIIQSPGNSQSMNPYSYIMNNPLSGTDPTGYCAASRIQSVCDRTDPHFGGTQGVATANQSYIMQASELFGAIVANKMENGSNKKNGIKPISIDKPELGDQGAIAGQNAPAGGGDKSSKQPASITFWIGGASDKERELLNGPTHIMKNAKELFEKHSNGAGISEYYGYRDREEIVERIIEIRKSNPDIDINLIGHSRGGAVAIDIAIRELSSAAINVNLLIALDPVKASGVLAIENVTQHQLRNVKLFVNVLATKNSFSNALAFVGGDYGYRPAKLTGFFGAVNVAHDDATRMMLAPIDSKSYQNLTPFDILLREKRN